MFQPDGTEREFAVSLTEAAQGRLYLGDCATIQPGDIIVAYDTVSGNIIGGREYKPSAIDSGSAKVVPAGYVGDYKLDDIVYFFWRTKVTPSVAGTIKIYRDDVTGAITTGITDDRNFAGLSNVNLCTVDLSATNAFATERDFNVIVDDITLDGQSADILIASFSIQNRFQGIDWKRDV